MCSLVLCVLCTQCVVCRVPCVLCSGASFQCSILTSNLAAKHRHPAVGDDHLGPHDSQREARDAVSGGGVHEAEGGRPHRHAWLDLRQRRSLPRLPAGEDRRYLDVGTIYRIIFQLFTHSIML